jgi:hypothetical protein
MGVVAWTAIGAALMSLVACGAGNPPQIIDYSPQRGALDVSTAAPIKISFDHAVDRSSVESRLRLAPATTGRVVWLSASQLVYEHSTLQVSTTYDVILDAGYRDPAGNAYSLRHHWTFLTEGPPAVAGSTPSTSDSGVDPASYLTVDFTRAMNATSLMSALTFTPSIPFSVRLDPADGRRAVIAPAQLLAPGTHYQLAINTAALDVDGNQLDRDQAIDFTTGEARPLRHWVAFVASPKGGPSGALWIVNESGFPRQLFGTAPVSSFSWSPAGDSLLIQSDHEAWWEVVPGGSAVELGFKATWAAALAAGMGYVYIDESGGLHRMSSEGEDDVIATDVAQAAVAPNGLRVAFVQGAEAPGEVWGYDVGLRSRYQLALDTGPVIDVAWAPSGNRIAYLRSSLGSVTLRVRNLTAAGSTSTIAEGDLGPPAWLPDSTHIVFAAVAQGATSPNHRAFVVNAVTPPASLSPGAGLPADLDVDVSTPVPSPDGHQIAFVSGGQVWLMNADGTRPTPLTRADPVAFPYSCSEPAWTRS